MRFAKARLMRSVLGWLAGALAGFVVGSPIGVATHGMLPILSLLKPTMNEVAFGQVTFYAGADSEGVASLRFQVDGQNVGSEITSGLCSATWDSTQVNDGLHTIQAVGRDQYGNVTLSLPITVLVSNPVFPPYVPPPTPGPAPTPAPSVLVTITAPLSGASVSGREVAISTKFPTDTLFLSYILQVRETGATSWSTRGPDLAQTQTTSVFAADFSAVSAGAYDLLVMAQRRMDDVISTKIPVMVVAPAPPPPLSMTLSTTGGRDFTLSASLKRGSLTVPGTLVTFAVTSPKGLRWTYTATTNAQGVASIQGKLTVKDPKGIYKVTATATASGLTATASGTFTY